MYQASKFVPSLALPFVMQALTERDLGVTKREQDLAILEERLAGREQVSFPPYKVDFKFSGSTDQPHFQWVSHFQARETLNFVVTEAVNL
jgi:hypothetical protein